MKGKRKEGVSTERRHGVILLDADRRAVDYIKKKMNLDWTKQTTTIEKIIEQNSGQLSWIETSTHAG